MWAYTTAEKNLINFRELPLHFLFLSFSYFKIFLKAANHRELISGVAAGFAGYVLLGGGEFILAL